MCAALAGPVRFLYVSVHLSVVPVSVALKAPDAPALTPFGGGVTCAALSAALNVNVGAAVCPFAIEPAASIPVPITAVSAMNRFTSSLQHVDWLTPCALREQASLRIPAQPTETQPARPERGLQAGANAGIICQR